MKLSELKQLQSLLPADGHLPDPAVLADALMRLGYDPHNLYQELEMESPYVDTHHDSNSHNAMLTLHSHTFYELISCRNSCGAEYLVGAERYRLQKGDIICVPPGISHRPILPERMEEPYRRDVIWLSQEFVDHLNSVFGNSNAYAPTGHRLLRTAGTRWEFITDLFRTGVWESERRESGWETVVMGNTLQILAHLHRAITNSGSLQAEQPELLDRIMAYIEENLDQQINLAQTAKRFFVSESTVSHLFKEKLGVSFYRCVTQRRLIAAKELIREGHALDQVARQVGFGEYSTFYRAFKQEYGISPRQYRNL